MSSKKFTILALATAVGLGSGALTESRPADGSPLLLCAEAREVRPSPRLCDVSAT